MRSTSAAFTITLVEIRRKVCLGVLCPAMPHSWSPPLPDCSVPLLSPALAFASRAASVLVCSGVLSAVALGVFVYVLWGSFTHGFKMFRVSLPPLAAFVLLLVMVAQNWFVFYEDREDVLRSSRPALVMLAAAVASALAWTVAGKHSFWHLLIWASAGSSAILLCIDPVQRSIERTRNVLVGTLIGIGKVLIPLTGIVIFLRGVMRRSPIGHVKDTPSSLGNKWFLTNLIGLFWDLGRLVLMILINGARIPPRPMAPDPFEIQGPQRNEQSITGEMSRLKRNSVVMIFVLAIHVLCGLVMVKA